MAENNLLLDGTVDFFILFPVKFKIANDKQTYSAKTEDGDRQRFGLVSSIISIPFSLQQACFFLYFSKYN